MKKNRIRERKKSRHYRMIDRATGKKIIGRMPAIEDGKQIHVCKSED